MKLTCLLLVLSVSSVTCSVFSDSVFRPFYEDLNLTSSETSISLEQFDEIYDEIFHISEDGHDGHGDDHDDHDDHRRRRQMHDHNECHSAEEVFEAYDANHDLMLSSEELLNASATLFFMVSEECEFPPSVSNETCTSRTTIQEAWGFSVLSVVLVSVPSLLGIAFLPVGGSKAMTYLLEGALALGVGTLLGSVLMHLLPLVLGVHNTEFLSEAERATLAQAGELDFLWPMCVSLLVFLVFLTVERVIRDWQRNHAVWRSRLLQVEVFELLDDWAEHDDAALDAGERANQRSLSPKELRPIAYVLVMADFLHNFADGLAIGASWVLNVRVGIATSLAVLCHEIPQEIGDYAVLIQSGVKRKTALFLNLAVSACCLLGALIGVGVGTSVGLAQRWVLSVAMGGFFYVALAAMVPVLTRIQGPRHSVLQAVMMLIGFAIMFLLAVFEFQIDCANL